MGPTTSSATSSKAEKEEETFDHALLRSYMRTLMEASLSHITTYEKGLIKKTNQQLSSRIKDRMIDIGPKHWKYIVTIMTNENLGQGGRADMANHWGPNDKVIQEIYSNQSIICVCFAYIVSLPVPARREILVPFSVPATPVTSSNYSTPRPTVTARNSSLPRITDASNNTADEQDEKDSSQ